MFIQKIKMGTGPNVVSSKYIVYSYPTAFSITNYVKLPTYRLGIVKIESLWAKITFLKLRNLLYIACLWKINYKKTNLS